jgi:hypothetical protein
VTGNGESRARAGPGSLGFGSPTIARQHPPRADACAPSVPRWADVDSGRWAGTTPYAAAAALDQPSTYSLTRNELRHEIAQLERDGWQQWEIEARFDCEGCDR